MMRISGILILLCIVTYSYSQADTASTLSILETPKFKTYWLDELSPESASLVFKTNKDSLPVNAVSLYTPSHEVTGMFCKMELKIEAVSSIAPRFRLGSQNYTDWMEGKKPLYMRYLR